MPKPAQNMFSSIATPHLRLVAVKGMGLESMSEEATDGTLLVRYIVTNWRSFCDADLNQVNAPSDKFPEGPIPQRTVDYLAAIQQWCENGNANNKPSYAEFKTGAATPAPAAATTPAPSRPKSPKKVEVAKPQETTDTDTEQERKHMEHNRDAVILGLADQLKDLQAQVTMQDGLLRLCLDSLERLGAMLLGVARGSEDIQATLSGVPPAEDGTPRTVVEYLRAIHTTMRQMEADGLYRGNALLFMVNEQFGDSRYEFLEDVPLPEQYIGEGSGQAGGANDDNDNDEES